MRTVSTSSGVAALLAAAAAVILPHLLFRQKIEFLLSSPPSYEGPYPFPLEAMAYTFTCSPLQV